LNDKDREFQADGSIIFVRSETFANSHGPIKRIAVTPDPNITFATGLAAAAAKHKARQDAIKLKGLKIQRACQVPSFKELPPE